ncbi:hypothetical protein [Pannonibacter phragmitetus]|uniref:hypothetical protein n=1 Tax=Pannonibacter phragmitetus TaxID=121719 RepID=UPI0013C47E34|nr:hypothetical protein [Pannonibacter phragmitetus]
MIRYPKSEMLLEAISHHFLDFRRLSVKRIMGIAFLCDWKHCIEYNSKISEAVWEIKDNWVSSGEFLLAMNFCDFLDVPSTDTACSPSIIREAVYPYKGGSTEDIVCEHIFSIMKQRTDFDFDKVILSTYPFMYSGPLDLVKVSKEYREKYDREYAQQRISA